MLGVGDQKWAYFCIQTSSNFICLLYSPICLLYCVIQDFVQEAFFSEIQALEVGGVTMYDKVGWLFVLGLTAL